MFKTFEMELAGRKLVIETGKMAKQWYWSLLQSVRKPEKEPTSSPLQWIMKKKCMRWVRCREDSSEEKVVRETLPF